MSSVFPTGSVRQSTFSALLPPLRGPWIWPTCRPLWKTCTGDRDCSRGIEATIAWLAEELGEQARAVRKGGTDVQLHELGDVVA